MARLPKPGAGGGGDFQPCPEGTFPGICYQIIHLGTQAENFKGEEKEVEQVRFAWELHDDDTKLDDGRPMMIGQDYTWSMHEKSNLRKVLESWKATSFGDQDFGEAGLDIQEFLGEPCMLTIKHNKSKSTGKVYANVAGVTKLHKSIRLPREPENELQYLWLSPEEFSPEAFAKLPEWLQDKIKKSPEYHQVAGGQARRPASEAKPKPGKRGFESDDDDSIPFAPEWR